MKNKIIITTGAVLIGVVSVIALKNYHAKDNDYIDYGFSNEETIISSSYVNEEVTEDFADEEVFDAYVEESSDELENEVSLDDYINEVKKFYEEYKPSEETTSYVIGELKDDLVSAPSDFTESATELYSLFKGMYDEKANVVENYSYIDDESGAYEICKLMDSYVNKKSYTETDLFMMIGMVNEALFGDMLTVYPEEEQYYLYLSVSNLIDKLKEYILLDNFPNISDECSNEEYLYMISCMTDAKLLELKPFERTS